MTERAAHLFAQAIHAGIERHQAHRSRLYRGPDGIWRCPECEPPSLWQRLAMHWRRR